MDRIFFICGALVLAGILFAISGHSPHTPLRQDPQKIVSLAPAITETLYALDLGDRVAGVTEFCAFPPEASQKTKVGGFMEVNPEAMARAGADLAILPADMAHFRKSIEDLGIPVMLFDYRSLHGFLDSAKALGKATGKDEEAARLAQDFSDAFLGSKPEKRPTVLFALLNPDEYDRPLAEMTIIGADKFYNEIIEAAGGQNAYSGAAPFPRLSLESVIAMNPDVIVVGAPKLADATKLEKSWRDIGHLKGVEGKRLLILNDPGDTIPGPRSLETLKKLGQVMQFAGGNS